METKNNIDPEVVVREWRTRILNGFLAIVVAIATVMTVATILDAMASPGLWPAVIVYVSLTLVMAVLAVFRGIDYRIRAWGVLMLCYIAGLATLATFGLGSSGRLYLLALPILALILMGTRPGMFASALSILTVVAFAILADRGVLGESLIRDRNSLLLADWLAEFADTLGILSVVMVLLILFYRFQERTIDRERHAQNELLHAQKLLEEQNTTLEHRIKERTVELQTTNLSLEQRNAELALLNSVGEAIVNSLDQKTLTHLVGDKMREIFDSDSVLIMLLDSQTNLIHVPYEYDKNEGGYIDYVEPFPLGTGLSSKVIATGESLMVGTLEEEIANGAYFPPEIIEKGSGFFSQSWLGVPIMTKEKVLGLVALADARPQAFNESHLRLLQTLSSNLGVAIENALLFQAEQQRVAELAIINSLQEALASKLDLQAIFELIGEKVCEVFNVQVVDIVIYDRASNLISMPYSYEKGDRGVITSREPYGFRLHVINSREPLLINEKFAELASQHDNPILTGACPKSALFMPLLVDEDVKGIISIQDLDRENAFSDSDVRLLQTLANAMSVAIENARLFDETQRLLKESQQRTAELATVNTVSSALASELDLEALINLVGEQIRSVFKTDIAYVALLDKERQIVTFPYQYGEHLEPIQFGQGLTSRIIQSGKPLLINQEMDRQRQQLSSTLVGKRARSFLGVPIFVSGEAIGVVSVQSTMQEGLFTENDQHLLGTIAANVGTALQNASFFTQVQSQKKFSEALIRTSPVAIVILDKDNKVSSWNPAAEKLFGYSQTEAQGRSIIDLVADNDEMRTESLGVARRMAQGELVHLITRRRNKDGRDVDVELFAVPVFLEENWVGTFAIYHDITELKLAEAAIQESERRLADIIDFLPDATLVIDHEGRVVAWNHAVEEMTGVASKEILGKGNYEYALPFYGERRPILIDLVLMPREEIEQKYAHIQWTGGILTGEAYTPALKNGARFLYATASALHDAQGNIVGAIETIRDITDRKHAEQELQKAKAEAEQANQAKSAFLANMSHELRTPLNAIIGFTRIVRRKAEGVLPDKQTENLDKVLVSAENLLYLINTVLDIAKIEAGRMDVLAANFRVSPLIDLCANTAQPLLHPTVALEKEVDDTLTIIYSDQDKIRQIILNLLSNAAKFTHEGRIVLSAGQEGENLRVTVADTGIGISPEALPNIFKEFEQADITTTRKYGGTGLGLTISRNLARLLGGDLTVESEPGQGSTFTLIVPKHYQRGEPQTTETPTPLSSDHVPASVSSTSPTPQNDSTKKHILVIDDDPDAVYLLQENLDQKEFEIRGSRNGPEGLRMAREKQPEAILLDILMPGADGWQVLHDLKNDPTTVNIPVILLTIVDKKALGFQLGAAAYLLKPIDPIAVREALDRVIVSHRPKRVLVVDDDPNVADMLRQFLPESDFSLESALDGEAGLRSIEANRPDILLLDIIMPRLDGFGVIESLRANPQTRDLPIIVISAKDLTADESSRLKETVSVVMKKQSFEGEKLVDEINHILGEHLATPQHELEGRHA